MGDQVYVLKDAEEMPVEPVGDLVTDGWLPGTFVKFSSLPHFITSGSIATVERSDGTGHLAGFTKTGNQHAQPVIELSDMWTTSTRQRDGGDTKADFNAFDAGGPLEFDDQIQLQRLGSRVVSIIMPPSGYHKFYVFETDDLAERTTPGTGAALTYSPGDPLYVSNRGRLTNEKESGSHIFTGFLVARADDDEEGDYLIVSAGLI
jgi:hypothetical protein